MGKRAAWEKAWEKRPCVRFERLRSYQKPPALHRLASPAQRPNCIRAPRIANIDMRPAGCRHENGRSVSST